MSIWTVAEALPVAVGDDGLLVSAGIHGGSLLQLSSCVYILNRFKYHYLMAQCVIILSADNLYPRHGKGETKRCKKEHTCTCILLRHTLVQQNTM